LSLLDDSLVLSEETLSFLVNMEINDDNLDIAMQMANEFHELLEGAELLLGELSGNVSSYEYLEEYLSSFQNLDVNTTALIQFYMYLNENMTFTEDYLNDTAGSNSTVDSAYESLNNSEENVEEVNLRIINISTNTNSIKDNGFSTTTMEELIIEAKELVESEEETLGEFSELFKVIPNFLSIYSDEPEFYLGDELLVYGYFFAEGSFATQQSITIFKDDEMAAEVVPDSSGRYEFSWKIPLNQTLGIYGFYASTIYNSSNYVSETINITIGKIPTKLSLSTSKSAYSSGETILFSGSLVDHKDQGISAKNISHTFLELTFSNILTDSQGDFEFELSSQYIPIGVYSAMVEFQSDPIYSGSIFEIIDIIVNIPTNLSLLASETRVLQGESITFSGLLIDEFDWYDYPDMIIELYIENVKISEVTTNDLGAYQFFLSTSDMSPGIYKVHSQFNSPDLQYSDSESETIEIEIIQPSKPASSGSVFGMIYDNSLIISLLFLIVLILAVFSIRERSEKKSSQPQMKRTGKSKKKPTKLITKYLIKETEALESKLLKLDEVKNVRETIIAGYHSLLGILEKNKVIKIKPSHTHLDIARNLSEQGFSQPELTSITYIFEKAMYSNQPIQKRTYNDFVSDIRKLVNVQGGISG
jgi:hypothetical protein